jgi:hypothetical protein
LRVVKRRNLRRIFGPKTEEVTECWRDLHTEELYSLHSPTDFIWVINSRRIKWAGHVVRMGEMVKRTYPFEDERPF